MTNTQFKDYPFNFQGVNFISKVDTTHPIYNAVSKLTEQEFVNLNSMALSELLAGVEISTSNLQEIQDLLNTLNEGGSYAYISLGENSL